MGRYQAVRLRGRLCSRDFKLTHYPKVKGQRLDSLSDLSVSVRTGQTFRGGYPADVTDAAVSVAAGAFLMASFVMIVLVLPAAVVLVRRRRLSLSTTLLIGLGFGNLPYVSLGILAGGFPGPAALLRGVAFSSLLGVAGAAIFWVIALRKSNALASQADRVRFRD